MSKHLISATLTAEAYECYQEWVKERKASKMISQCIIEQFADISQAEQIIEWRKTRLVELIRILLQKINTDDWHSINEFDRDSIYQLARPDKSFSMPEIGGNE
jgi:DUF438 domain-containing protein